MLICQLENLVLQDEDVMIVNTYLINTGTQATQRDFQGIFTFSKMCLYSLYLSPAHIK